MKKKTDIIAENLGNQKPRIYKRPKLTASGKFSDLTKGAGLNDADFGGLSGS